jgi:hypothetical protein
MKIICECGNEAKLNTTDVDTGEETEFTEGEGQYATVDTFTFWQQHDVVGVVCDKCEKALWMFC